MPDIWVNGTPKQLEGNPTVLDLLREMKMEKRLLLVRLNGNIVSKPNWTETGIRDEDNIDIEHIIQAGG